MRKIPNARSSRRAPALKDSDYDHEINLVDHAAETATPQPLSPEPPELPEPAANAPATSHTAETSTIQAASKHATALSTPTGPQQGPSLRSKVRAGSRATVPRSRSGSSGNSDRSKRTRHSPARSPTRRSPKARAEIPRVEVNEPTPLSKPRHFVPNESPRHRTSPETAIDVLYENQRGGFLCGVPLFSPKALGQLDPPAWTNVVHKPSPTNIKTAQVPDPSWEWAWPAWHVNRDIGVDEDGWEYSFMFAKTFSWHPAKWYNSFVRRRAWIRKRARRNPDTNDPHMLNTEYFTVRPSADTIRTGSMASSCHSRASMSISSWVLEKRDIEDIETLMSVLSRARIDREKIEAVEIFLDHGGEELVRLQDKMHDIMAIFVFQASRRVLLSKLNKVFEAAQEQLKEDDTGRLQRRSDHLRAAIRHADEEVKRLEYWSDQRKLVREGRANSATDKYEGWDESWRGVDNSGPGMPDPSKCNSV